MRWHSATGAALGAVAGSLSARGPRRVTPFTPSKPIQCSVIYTPLATGFQLSFMLGVSRMVVNFHMLSVTLILFFIVLTFLSSENILVVTF